MRGYVAWASKKKERVKVRATGTSVDSKIYEDQKIVMRNIYHLYGSYIFA